MITDHVWRPPMAGWRVQLTPILDRPCLYLNCGRPIEDHRRATRTPQMPASNQRGRHERLAGA
jgi:hypothetical protein